MSDKTIPFVITDRRRHTTEGEVRPDADPRAAPRPPPARTHPHLRRPPAGARTAPHPNLRSRTRPLPRRLPPTPTPEQMEQSRIAFLATADRIDTAVRAANPGADHPPALTFESLIQSVYMQAILQLGGSTPEGQQPQIDILGARQSIDMLGILNDKTQQNLTPAESSMLLSALFELRLAFLEVTQALARSAQQRTPTPPPSGPQIVVSSEWKVESGK